MAFSGQPRVATSTHGIVSLNLCLDAAPVMRKDAEPSGLGWLTFLSMQV
jgi:hypothetical protein